MIPDDFAFSKITIPLSFHYSISDKLVVSADVEKLISQLSNAVVYVQHMEEPFGHIDYIWSPKAAPIIYSKILNLFQKYECWVNTVDG